MRVSAAVDPVDVATDHVGPVNGSGHDGASPGSGFGALLLLLLQPASPAPSLVDPASLMPRLDAHSPAPGASDDRTAPGLPGSDASSLGAVWLTAIVASAGVPAADSGGSTASTSGGGERADVAGGPGDATTTRPGMPLVTTTPSAVTPADPSGLGRPLASIPESGGRVTDTPNLPSVIGDDARTVPPTAATVAVGNAVNELLHGHGVAGASIIASAGHTSAQAVGLEGSEHPGGEDEVPGLPGKALAHAENAGTAARPSTVAWPHVLDLDGRERASGLPAGLTTTRRPSPIDSVELPGPTPSVTSHSTEARVETPAAVAVPVAASVEAPPAADQVVRAARIVVSDGLTHMEVRLEPPSLGAVRIMATAGADGLGLTIVAERPETRALLMHAIPEMQAALAGHGATTPSISIAATFEPPTERRAPTRRDPDRPSRDTRGFSDRRSSSRAEQSVTAVDLTV